MGQPPLRRLRESNRPADRGGGGLNTARLHTGDHVQARVNGVVFTAIFERRLQDGHVEVTPIPRWATWRRIRASQVVRKLSGQGRLI